MPSNAFTRWESERLPHLDELEAAHAAVGGTSPGRRFATLRVNHAYAVLVSSAFQGFCRDLHSEAVDILGRGVGRRSLRFLFTRQMTQGRKLDVGNPNPDNLGADFGRVFSNVGGFWDAVLGVPVVAAVKRRKEKLEELNRWRNAIAHQDWTKVGNSSKLQLQKVQEWRKACEMLARRFDKVLGDELQSLTGRAPW